MAKKRLTRDQKRRQREFRETIHWCTTAACGVAAYWATLWCAKKAAAAAEKGTEAILNIIKDKKGAADPAPAADNTAPAADDEA